MDHTRQITQALYTLFGSEVEDVARQTDFVQRSSPLTGLKFLLTSVLGWLEKPDAGLGYLSQVAADLGAAVTRQALQGRLTPEALNFMKAMFARARAHLQNQVPLPLPVLTQFNAVLLLDSSAVALPDSLAPAWPAAGGSGPKAGFKVQVLWEFVRDHFTMELTSALHADQRYGQDLAQDLEQASASWLVPGGLFIADLGYFVVKVLQAIDQAHAYFLSRWDPGTGVYDLDTGERVDLLKRLNALPACTPPVEYRLALGHEVRLPCRVLVVRVPPAVAAQRERRLREAARRKRGSVPSAERVAWCQWSVYVTNVPVTCLTLDQAVLLYVLRWQIELLFRLWKSEGQLDRVAGRLEPRVWCEVYAKLIGLLVFHALTAPLRWLPPDHELSLPKALQTLRRHIRPLLCAWRFPLGPDSWDAWLDAVEADWRKYALKDKRRTRLSTLRLLDLAALQTLFPQGVSVPVVTCA